MGVNQKIWLYFLQDAITSQVYYLDEFGNVKKDNPLEKQLQLPQSPIGWDEIELSFGRSSHYWGINRTFTIPLKFVGDGAKIVRTLFYTGKGVEEPVNLVICKLDQDAGVYNPYYSGRLDLSKVDDQVAEGVTVNIMEGGAVQFFKAFENTIIPIPLDGSIQENIKINASGRELNDTFHYQIIPVENSGASNGTVPCAFLNNDGDNIGITKNDSIGYDDFASPYVPANYLQVSSNYLFADDYADETKGIDVRIRGYIVWKPTNPSTINALLYATTNLSQVIGSGPDRTRSWSLVPGSAHYYDPIQISGQTVSYFDRTINLARKERLFLLFSGGVSSHHLSIIGGSFSLSFTSRYLPSRVWAIKPYDAGKYLMRKLCDLSQSFAQPANYGFDSSLLQENQNFVLTSGDAARASTDPNYYQYFNQATINPNNPSNPDYNQFAFIGPALKISMVNLFDGYNPILNASLSNQTLGDSPESIFLEEKRYVLNPDSVTMILTDISNFRVSVAMDYYWNWLKIGYKPNDYDEKAGKYEYNNTNQYQGPLRTISKTLELISPLRADSYGFELVRYNTQGGKSSTYNGSDNSIFVLDVDFSSYFMDYYRGYFQAGIVDPASAVTDNQKLTILKNYQPVYADTLDGDYFTSNNDFSIFFFNQPISAVLYLVRIDFTAILNGLIGDGATIKMWINGVVVQTWTATVTGVNTPFSTPTGGTTFSRNFSQGDNFYFTVDTSGTCTIEIDPFTVSVGSGYFTCQTAGPVNISASSTQQLISLPLITATLVSGLPVVSSGFQYFRFLSTIGNKSFDWTLSLDGYTDGDPGDTLTFDVWRNGVNIGTVSYSGRHYETSFNASHATLLSGTISFSLYDIVWITASNGNQNAWISYADWRFTSQSVKVYSLRNPTDYDNISGIPNPASAFNIELSPGRMARKNASLLVSTLWNLAPGMLTFQTADKNQFLSTTKAGVTISERGSFNIHDLGSPLFYPYIFEFDTAVPINFADLLNNAANRHIEFIYKNKSFYGFPIQVTAKPALNESQTWKLLCSPKTNLSDLVDLDWDGLPALMPFDISIPIICPLHVVPLALVKDDRDKNATMDEDWYVNRIQTFIDRKNYAMPRQSNEPIEFQCQTNGLSPVSIQAYGSNGLPVGAPYVVSQISNPAVIYPEILFQDAIPIDTYADGIYYFVFSIGTGQGTGMFITEGVHVKQTWDNSTIRFKYKHSGNHLSTIFTSGFYPTLRVHGKIGWFTPKSKSTTYTDQPQNSRQLNGIPYDTWRLEIGRGSGVPDYLQRKVARIFDLDTVFIDGTQYTRDGDAQWENQNFPGQAKQYMTLEIRRANNIDALTYNTGGQLTSEQLAGYTINPTAFGNNMGQDLVYVSNS